MKQLPRTCLIEERKHRQWSQQEVANLLGTTQHNVSRWERGQTARGSYFRSKLCELFLLQDVGAQVVWTGDYEQAVACYEEGLCYARELGDLQRQSALLMNLGMLAWYQRKLDEAISFSQESRKLAREIGHQMRISSVLQNLGMLMRVCDQDAQAAEYLQESLSIAQTIGHRWLICETLGEVGLLTLKQGQMVQANEYFTEMQRLAQEIQAPMLPGLAIFGLAQVAEQAGRRSKALRLAEESMAIFVALNNQINIREIEAWRMMLSEHDPWSH